MRICERTKTVTKDNCLVIILGVLGSVVIGAIANWLAQPMMPTNQVGIVENTTIVATNAQLKQSITIATIADADGEKPTVVSFDPFEVTPSEHPTNFKLKDDS